MLAGALVLASTVTLSTTSGNAAEQRPRTREPLVIAHRGASAYRPEETMHAYRLAIEMGADYIEPDVVTTKDRVLVARHDNWLNDTTDVADHPEFAGLKKTKTIDGTKITDWFTEDFTYAQLKTLRTRERLNTIRLGNTAYDGLDPIPTLDEVVKLAVQHHAGVYPETKHPTYFTSIGLPLEGALVSLLNRYGLNKPTSKVFIQSFEPGSLEKMRKLTRAPEIQLIDAGNGRPYDFVVSGDPRTYADLVKPAGLKWLAGFANGIGPALTRILPVDKDNHVMKPTTLVRDAHRAGLAVHPWTVRPENSFLPVEYQQGDPKSPNFARAEGNASAYLAFFFKQGVDGIFSDDSALAVATRHRVFGR